MKVATRHNRTAIPMDRPLTAIRIPIPTVTKATTFIVATVTTM